MRRPSLQFYPADWQANPKLKLCSHAEKGMWLDVLCILHDQDEYGIVRWPLRELAKAIHVRAFSLHNLTRIGVLKGGDATSVIKRFTYTPRSGRKDGDTVILIPEQQGPLWYSSRMVRDEYVRNVKGLSTRFGSDPPSPYRRHGERQGEGVVEPITLHPTRARPSSSSSSSSKNSLIVGVDHSVRGDNRDHPFDHFAVIEYTDKLDFELAIGPAESIAVAVSDSPLSRAVWTETLDRTKANGYSKRHVWNSVDHYQKEMVAIVEGTRLPPAGFKMEAQRTQTIREKLGIADDEVRAIPPK